MAVAPANPCHSTIIRVGLGLPLVVPVRGHRTKESIP
jgi:hypothetical protein